MGHSIEAEQHEVLSKWLINHIQHDDADYVGAVKENMMGIIKEKEKKKGKHWFARFSSSPTPTKDKNNKNKLYLEQKIKNIIQDTVKQPLRQHSMQLSFD